MVYTKQGGTGGQEGKGEGGGKGDRGVRRAEG